MNDIQTKHCPRCKSDIKIPPLTREQKEEITTLKNSKGIVSAIDRIIKLTRLDLKDSKGLAIHINETGHCNRCNFDRLQGENLICPKCKSFNLNWD